MNIAFDLKENANVTIRIIDIQGRELMRMDRNNLDVGKQTQIFDVNSLSKGIYIVDLVINDKRYNEKFIKE